MQYIKYCHAIYNYNNFFKDESIEILTYVNCIILLLT